MAYHHVALAAHDMRAIHAFYEGVLGFELAKVEIAPVPSGGWGKHFFYRMDGDDSSFIAFWELFETAEQDRINYDLNAAAHLPPGTNHLSFAVASVDELHEWRKRWNDAGLRVLEIDHNWCHSIYTYDPNGNFVEFCCTTGSPGPTDRERALIALNETEFRPSPPPALTRNWPAKET